MDYDGSLECLMVCYGYSVCGGDVFLSLKTVLGLIENILGSDTNTIESALMWSKIRRIDWRILGLEAFINQTKTWPTSAFFVLALCISVP